MNSPILFSTDLSVGYQTKNDVICVAKNINLKLEKGSLIALVGANGIGKSTLLRTLAGLQKPLAGSVYIHEKDVQTIDAATLSKNLSLVLTEKLPPSNLTVFEIVALGRQPYTDWLGKMTFQDELIVQQALKITEIEDLQAKKHFEVSDGQLQKVLISRAFAQDTELIILDEPTTHLDLVNRFSIFKLLKKLSTENQKCILFSTHEIDLALQIADEIIIFTEDFVLQDKPETLIKNGTLNQIFKDKAIYFDAAKGSFVI